MYFVPPAVHQAAGTERVLTGAADVLIQVEELPRGLLHMFPLQRLQNFHAPANFRVVDAAANAVAVRSSVTSWCSKAYSGFPFVRKTPATSSRIAPVSATRQSCRYCTRHPRNANFLEPSPSCQSRLFASAAQKSMGHACMNNMRWSARRASWESGTTQSNQTPPSPLYPRPAEVAHPPGP